MNDQALLRIAKSFRRGLLGKRKPDGMCFAVCAPLQGLLAFEGLESRLVSVEFEFSNHTFLLLADGRILDPTADQFPESGLPAVYLGALPTIYKEWSEHVRRTKEDRNPLAACPLDR